MLHYANATAAAQALAGRVTDILGTITEHQRPLLALPGGNSPRYFLPHLFSLDLKWQDIDLTLTDERWCNPCEPGSNQYLIESVRRGTPAAMARLLPLRTESPAPGAAVKTVSATFHGRLPPFVTILGVGSDGHIASLFTPSDCQPGKDIAFTASQGCDGSPRLSMSFQTLAASEHLLLFFGGADKEAVARQMTREDLPVGQLLAARPDTQAFIYL